MSSNKKTGKKCTDRSICQRYAFKVGGNKKALKKGPTTPDSKSFASSDSRRILDNNGKVGTIQLTSGYNGVMIEQFEHELLDRGFNVNVCHGQSPIMHPHGILAFERKFFENRAMNYLMKTVPRPYRILDVGLSKRLMKSRNKNKVIGVDAFDLNRTLDGYNHIKFSMLDKEVGLSKKWCYFLEDARTLMKTFTLAKQDLGGVNDAKIRAARDYLMDPRRPYDVDLFNPTGGQIEEESEGEDDEFLPDYKIGGLLFTHSLYYFSAQEVFDMVSQSECLRFSAVIHAFPKSKGHLGKWEKRLNKEGYSEAVYTKVGANVIMNVQGNQVSYEHPDVTWQLKNQVKVKGGWVTMSHQSCGDTICITGAVVKGSPKLKIPKHLSDNAPIVKSDDVVILDVNKRAISYRTQNNDQIVLPTAGWADLMASCSLMDMGEGMKFDRNLRSKIISYVRKANGGQGGVAIPPSFTGCLYILAKEKLVKEGAFYLEQANTFSARVANNKYKNMCKEDPNSLGRFENFYVTILAWISTISWYWSWTCTKFGALGLSRINKIYSKHLSWPVAFLTVFLLIVVAAIQGGFGHVSAAGIGITSLLSGGFVFSPVVMVIILKLIFTWFTGKWSFTRKRKGEGLEYCDYGMFVREAMVHRTIGYASIEGRIHPDDVFLKSTRSWVDPTKFKMDESAKLKFDKDLLSSIHTPKKSLRIIGPVPDDVINTTFTQDTYNLHIAAVTRALIDFSPTAESVMETAWKELDDIISEKDLMPVCSVNGWPSDGKKIFKVEFEEWNNKPSYDTGKRKTNLLNWNKVLTHQFKPSQFCFDIFLKVEPQPLVTRAPYIPTRPRMISASSKVMKVVEGPFGNALSKHVNSMWGFDENIVYMSGATADLLNRSVNDTMQDMIDPYFFSSDMSKYDVCQKKWCRLSEYKFMKKAGFFQNNPNMLYVYQGDERTRAYGKGVSYVIHWTRKSGQAVTSVCNSLNTGKIIFYALYKTYGEKLFKNRKSWKLYVLGDDNFMIIDAAIFDVSILNESINFWAGKLGFVLTTDEGNNPIASEFLSFRFYPTKSGLRVGKKPGRVITRLGVVRLSTTTKKDSNCYGILKSNLISMVPTSNHVPFLRVVIQETLKHLVDVEVVETTKYNSTMNRGDVYEPDEETFSAFEDYYGLSENDEFLFRLHFKNHLEKHGVVSVYHWNGLDKLYAKDL